MLVFRLDKIKFNTDKELKTKMFLHFGILC